MSVAFASSSRLAVRTVELRDRRPLLSHLPAAAPLCWLRGGDGLVAWGEAARAELPAEGDPRGGRRFSEAARLLRDLFADAEVDDAVGLPGTGPVAFASFTFDARSNGSVLVVPSVVAGRRDGHTWLTTIGGRGPGSHPEALTAPGAPLRPVGPLTWGPGSLSAEEWCGAVGAAVDRIRGGGLDKAVLARDAFADAERAVDPRTLLGRLAAAHPECYTFAVDGLVGATPELLLRREGDRVESLVLAGTRRRGATREEDAALAEDLLASDKDGEEHRYAVESLRAALGPLATEVAASPEPELLRLANVQHLASPASAELRPGVSTLDAVAALHPTAAVGGTPTAEAVELIRELEGMDRGRYAGPVGWIDAQGRGEWAIALRCAQVSGSRARLFAGCGIVAGSDPQAELAEADSKFRVMAEALTDR
ncbi:isochorismate synthase [Nocardiopsis suaedae]|uniref:isochorismate synthase n=1 Tax=Nocardiopsis suaedae TaxID=3018444 RepID=A0ABT4TUT9_9ACTN|nr:isochorismate synthase [Nocardiopsis suaedae]MDA2808480.1 isochorismate synthase [Nocardiopsis suaedae]